MFTQGLITTDILLVPETHPEMLDLLVAVFPMAYFVFARQRVFLQGN